MKVNRISIVILIVALIWLDRSCNRREFPLTMTGMAIVNEQEYEMR